MTIQIRVSFSSGLLPVFTDSLYVGKTGGLFPLEVEGILIQSSVG